MPLQVKEHPDTSLLIHTQPKNSFNSLPFLVKVNAQNTIHLPCVNNTKAVKEFRTGTLVGSYEPFDAESEYLRNDTEVIRITHEMQNDLLPTTDQANTQGSRSERLTEIIKRQMWNHLTREEGKTNISYIGS